MPYFKWYGIDAHTTVHRGTDFARSPEHLARILTTKKALTLISCTPQKIYFFSYPSTAQKALFFNQISTLLTAGIRIHQALIITAQSLMHPLFKKVVLDCIQAVEEGTSLSNACMHHTLFDPFACQLIAIGEESGTVAAACSELAQYYTLRDIRIKKIRAMLIMPAITLLFFGLVVGILFVVVIPRFSLLLQSLNKPLPPTTQRLIALSTLIKKPSTVLYTLMTSISLCMLVGYISRTRIAQGIFSGYYKLPVIRTWVQACAAQSFFRSLGTVLHKGIAIDRALHLATASIINIPLRTQYEKCTVAVKSGTPLSNALRNSSLDIHEHCITLITLGESTGTLAPLLIECAHYYQEKAYTLLAKATQLIQPLLLIVLGLLVALLIFTLYEPLFTLTDIVV